MTGKPGYDRGSIDSRWMKNPDMEEVLNRCQPSAAEGGELMALTEQDKVARQFGVGEYVWYLGKRYLVWDYVRHSSDRRWLKDAGGRLKAVNVDELSYTKPERDE